MHTDAQTMVSYDLLNPETLANPWSLYQQMREEDPVHFLEAAHFWVITRYKDVLDLLRNPGVSADRGALSVRALGEIDLEKMKDYLQLITNMMVFRDGMDHTVIRKIANQGFLTKFTDMWRRMTQQIIDELIDRVEGRGSMELVEDFAYILPGEIIAEIFGVPKEDRENFQRWSTIVGDFSGIVVNEGMEERAREANAAAGKLIAYFNQKIEERRENPKDDVISLLISGYEGGKLNHEELTSQCFLIITAGFLTTVEMIPNAINQFLRHPEQLQKLRENPSLLDSAVEECLRYDTSVPMIFRIAIDDIQIGDKVIPKGHIMALALSAANRDPQQFESPEVFDITRKNNKHVTFGFGAHYCLGAPLAKIEIGLAIETLFRRLPNLRFDEQHPAEVMAHNMQFKGYKSMRLKFDPK